MTVLDLDRINERATMLDGLAFPSCDGCGLAAPMSVAPDESWFIERDGDTVVIGCPRCRS